ncbi:hypothetical protein Asp14428_74080 [Actinoplanes sp. NBRC 14428]|nr:hypothetical protein Asp14428_74080 [Actinoplanes sp. NBRC 14428]
MTSLAVTVGVSLFASPADATATVPATSAPAAATVRRTLGIDMRGMLPHQCQEPVLRKGVIHAIRHDALLTTDWFTSMRCEAGEAVPCGGSGSAKDQVAVVRGAALPAVA